MRCFLGPKLDPDRKAVTLSKHWPARYKLRVRTPRKWYFSVQWGVKKATKNQGGKKGGPRHQKERQMVPKGEPKAVKNDAKNEAGKRGGTKREKKDQVRYDGSGRYQWWATKAKGFVLV